MTSLVDLPLTLTVEECADVLRIGRSAAYQAVKTGEIPSIKVGRSIRVPRHRLEQLLGLQNESSPAATGLDENTAGGNSHEQAYNRPD